MAKFVISSSCSKPLEMPKEVEKRKSKSQRDKYHDVESKQVFQESWFCDFDWLEKDINSTRGA